MSEAMAAATREVGAEIDRSRFGGLQLTVLVLCFLVAAFDGLDAQIIAFAAPALAEASAPQATPVSHCVPTVGHFDAALTPARPRLAVSRRRTAS